MKRTAKRVCSLLLALTLLLSAGASASADTYDLRIAVDGKYVTFNSDLGYPYADNNSRTMVPFRAVANFMSGVDVWWNGSTRCAAFQRSAGLEVGSKTYTLEATMVFPLDTNQAWLVVHLNDGDTVLYSYQRFTQMDTLSVGKNGRTYAPIRYLAEGLDYTVTWNGATRTVGINAPTWDWAQAFYSRETSRGYSIVTSEYVARQYAYYFARAGHYDLNPSVTYLGAETLQSGEKIWNFRHNGVDFFVVDDGSVYYYDSDVDYYVLWT